MDPNDIKYNAAPLRQTQKTIRGIRSASIPVAVVNTVPGVHTITFINTYNFGTFVKNSVGSPMELGSIIHAGIGSRGPDQSQATGGRAAYFNADAGTDTSESDETWQTVFSPPGIAGQPIAIPLFGCNKMSASLYVFDTVYNASADFSLTLYRVVNQNDNAVMANNADSNMAVAAWYFSSRPNHSSKPQLNFTDFMLPTGACFYLELANLTSIHNMANNVNLLAGDIFFHA